MFSNDEENESKLIVNVCEKLPCVWYGESHYNPARVQKVLALYF